MRIKELTVTAVVPTAQYANIQPSITVEVDDDYDAAKATAMQHIAAFSSQYAENGKALPAGGSLVSAEEITCFTSGTSVLYDDIAHAYCDKEGNVYTSGSKYAHQFEQPFPKEAILPIYAKKYGVEPSLIEAYWNSKSECSTTFGTALHNALERYGKYWELSEKLGKDDGVHPSLLPIVQAFFTPERKKETALYEPFIADKSTRRCGRIDRLVITGDKKCIIEDYKTNVDIYKQNSPKTLKAPFDNLPNQPISGYKIQLNFYRAILANLGWTVEGLRVHHWDSKEWKVIELGELEIA